MNSNFKSLRTNYFAFLFVLFSVYIFMNWVAPLEYELIAIENTLLIMSLIINLALTIGSLSFYFYKRKQNRIIKDDFERVKGFRLLWARSIILVFSAVSIPIIYFGFTASNSFLWQIIFPAIVYLYYFPSEKRINDELNITSESIYGITNTNNEDTKKANKKVLIWGLVGLCMALLSHFVPKAFEKLENFNNENRLARLSSKIKPGVIQDSFYINSSIGWTLKLPTKFADKAKINKIEDHNLNNNKNRIFNLLNFDMDSVNLHSGLSLDYTNRTQNSKIIDGMNQAFRLQMSNRNIPIHRERIDSVKIDGKFFYTIQYQLNNTQFPEILLIFKAFNEYFFFLNLTNSNSEVGKEIYNNIISSKFDFK